MCLEMTVTSEFFKHILNNSWCQQLCQEANVNYLALHLFSLRLKLGSSQT